MYRFKRKNKKLSLCSLAKVATISGLAVFLNGCDGNGIDDDCKKNINMQPQSKIDECNKKNITTGSGGGSHHTSGYFATTSTSGSSFAAS